MALEENAIITIHGRVEPGNPQITAEDTDTIQLMTRGYYTRRGKNFFISYKETETTGYAGCTTTVKVSEDGRQVTMLRLGAVNSQLVIEKGTRHICHYETGYGAMSLGVAADEITYELTEDGGVVDFSYTLDTEAQLLSRNSVHITVKRAH